MVIIKVQIKSEKNAELLALTAKWSANEKNEADYSPSIISGAVGIHANKRSSEHLFFG